MRSPAEQVGQSLGGEWREGGARLGPKLLRRQTSSSLALCQPPPFISPVYSRTLC